MDLHNNEVEQHSLHLDLMERWPLQWYLNGTEKHLDNSDCTNVLDKLPGKILTMAATCACQFY